MKTIITNIVIFFSIFFLSIGGSYFITSSYLKNPKILQFDKKYTKLVLGDSQAQCSINDSLTTNMLNFALAADSYFYSYIKLKAILRENPQIDTLYLALASINLSEFAEHKWDRNTALIQNKLPKYMYFFDNEDFNYFLEINPKATIKSIIHIPKHAIKIGLKKLVRKITFRDLELGGFEGLTKSRLDREIAKVLNDPVVENYVLSDLQTENLSRVRKLCKEKNVELIFFHAPMHPVQIKSISKEERDAFNNYREKHLSEYTYLDYSTYKMEDKYYSDLVHLNLQGANIFTKTLFKENLKEKYKN